MNAPIEDTNYYDFCNQLHKDWYDHRFSNEIILQENFQMEYTPEPFFSVSERQHKPLYMLLTNPGQGLDFQHISNFSKSDYTNFSKVLGTVYTSKSFKKDYNNAYRRLINSQKFAYYLGYNSIVNVETIPFHSPNFKKSKALKVIAESPTIQSYIDVLKKFLQDKPVLIVSACSTKKSINSSTLEENKWLSFLFEIANIDKHSLIIKPLTKKNSKITSALFSQNNKNLVLTMGSNNLPNIRE